MSRLTEYLPELTGVVFDIFDDWEKQNPAKPSTSGGGTATANKPAEKPYSEQQREQHLKEPGYTTLAALRADPTAKWFGTEQIRLSNGTVYNHQAGEDTWKVGNNWFTNNKSEVGAFQNAKPVGEGTGATTTTGGGTTGGGGVLPGVRGGLTPEARQFGPPDATSLPNTAGVNIPGWDAFRQPVGIPNVEGRQQLFDREGLNQMKAGSQGSATQFPVSPGFRAPGQAGNNIVFSGNERTLEPAMTFGPAEANVPGSYVRGQGNVNDANRAFALPFNIGPGGAALANVAGNNVQVNSADKGTGYGFALNAMPASNPFALTGRNASEDPALQTIQTLMLNSAIAQGRMGDLMATNPNQFGGNRAGTGNGPSSGNGGLGQGTFWSGYAPDPLGATPGAGAGAGAGGTGLPPDYQSSASSLFQNQGAGYMGGAGAGGGGGSPYQSSAADLFSSGGRGYMGGTGTAPGAAAGMFAAGGGGYMGGASLPGAPTPGANPLLSNVQNSLAPVPPVAGGVPPPAAAAPAAAPAATLLAQLQAMREEEERGGGGYGGGYGPDGGQKGGFSRGGNVYAGLPGFAAGGGVTTVPQGVGGSLNPTGAAPAIDAGLMGSLASPGAGAAVQTTTTPSANPAANAIQPVQGPQSTAVVTPTGVAPQAQGQVAPQAVAPQAATTPPPATTPPVQPGLDPNVLSRFYDSMTKQAEQQRMRTQTFGNRWQAAGLQAPTAVQLQPGQEMPGEYLPPGMYYDISEALSGLVGGIRSKQLDLAALGEIGDPEQLLNQMTGYQQQQAPYKQALDLKLALAGLGNNLGNPEDLQAQITQLDMSMGPLADALKAKDKLTELGPGRDLTNEFNAVNQWQTEMERWTVPEGEPYNETFENARLAAQNMLTLAKDALSAGIAHNRAVQEAGDVYNQVFSALGIPAEQAAQQMGQYAAQRDTLKQGYEAALKAQQYQNQIGYLTGGLDPVAETARIQALIDASKQSYGNVELAGNLNRQIAALAQQGQRLPGFAKGGNWIAGATANSHGQFASKAKKAGMSTKAYASKMSDAPGRTGKQARLAKTLMSFADGGAMTTQEPIIGIGMFSGKPRFQVGEPQYPGGPPMAERLQITPLNRPSALPMGGMRRAA